VGIKTSLLLNGRDVDFLIRFVYLRTYKKNKVRGGIKGWIENDKRQIGKKERSRSLYPIGTPELTAEKIQRSLFFF